MEESILKFPAQFTYQPQIENADKLSTKDKLLVLGMGGSHLPAGILKAYDQTMPILIHWDYDLPPLAETELADHLIIACSYSGNTEEVISGLKAAIAKGLAVAVISTGGQLIKIAQAHSLPYVQIPQTGIQPRSASGFLLRALLKLAGREDLLTATDRLADLQPTALKQAGQELAETLKGKVPIIYTSRTNSALAYNWKIKFNETGKIPAFYNSLPELNHNEMTGFDPNKQTTSLIANFAFILLTDNDDPDKIKHRLTILAKLYRDRNLSVTEVALTGDDRLTRLFNSLLLADWTAYFTARHYSSEPEAVPMIEEFKHLLN